ncbi:SPOR domain-containing protein [Rhizobium sp.]
MADNKLLAKRADEDFLSEDDPLAELTRLVGFDPAPAPKPSQSVQQRREPAFDLEDELLKELEIYQQPASAEARGAQPAYVPAAAPEPRIEPQYEPAAAPAAAAPQSPYERASQVEPVRQPVILEAVETYSDPSGEHVYERPASHPVFDLEDEILREFSAFDARRVSHAEEHPVAVEVVHQELPAAEPQFDAVPAELHDVPDSRSTFAPVDHGRDIYASFHDDDLDAAITGALASEAFEPAEAPLASAIPRIEDGPVQPEAFSVASLQPLDESFWSNPAADTVAARTSVEEPVAFHADAETIEEPVAEAGFVEPQIEDFVEQDEELVSQDFSDVIPATPVAHTEVAPAHIAPASASVSSAGYGLDDLLAEVERYPVADNTARWGVQSKPVAAEDIVRASAPVVQDFAAQTVPGQGNQSPDNLNWPGIARANPSQAAASPGTVAQPADAMDSARPAPVTAAAVFSAEAKAEPFIDDSHFEIDIGEIELDLSDLNDSEMFASADQRAGIAAAPVAIAREPEPASVQPMARSADTDYSSLPFDPSQITPEDETFEAIAEMDVPEIPVIHEEEKPAPHPEYDIDLDAEMAQLFATATAQPAMSSRGGQADDAAISIEGAARSQPAGLDIDDFERALEEDFRRSFAENRSSSTPDRVPLAPLHTQTRPARSQRSWVVMAGVAAAIVVFGGAGVYAFMSSDVKIINSGDPKVIMADTDPVKVLPEDPGGKQVPNQNKAVYDRVAGEKVDTTKQESLLTSNEEPVDVVQRTLMPETLPMDDDSMAAATPTGDTIDPRLLPDEDEADRVTTTNKVVSGVSPRKVKTMVVRPDGSLVEREVTEDDLKQQATNDAELMKIAQKAAQDAATASDSQADDIAKAIADVPERLAATDDTVAKPDDKAARAETPVENKVAEVPPVQPVAIEDEQPVVAEKPVERSININPTPDSADADAVARAADATVADQEADAPVRKVKTTKISAVPEVRPADQPVDIVGTVDDQGTVRSDTQAKTEEVALADPAEKPAEAAPLPAGSYVIQIASLPSEAEAQTSYNRLSAKFPGIIGGKGVDIRRAEIKNKGTYYRVRIPAGSRQEANALCSEYKAAGGSCLVSK